MLSRELPSQVLQVSPDQELLLQSVLLFPTCPLEDSVSMASLLKSSRGRAGEIARRGHSVSLWLSSGEDCHQSVEVVLTVQSNTILRRGVLHSCRRWWRPGLL